MFNNEAFIEQLIIKANPEIDDEGLDLLIEDIKPVLFDWTMTNWTDKLSDPQLQELMNLIKNKAPEKEIKEYLNKETEDYDAFIEKIYLDFEKMYLEEYKDFSTEQNSQK